MDSILLLNELRVLLRSWPEWVHVVAKNLNAVALRWVMIFVWWFWLTAANLQFPFNTPIISTISQSLTFQTRIPSGSQPPSPLLAAMGIYLYLWIARSSTILPRCLEFLTRLSTRAARNPLQALLRHPPGDLKRNCSIFRYRMNMIFVRI